ncbi:MAG: hypothetical protein AAB426_14840 [Myxococcota bacterium]
MKIISILRRAARERVIYPIAGRVFDHYLRWLRGQDGWDQMVPELAHVLIESSTAVGVRTTIAEAVRDAGPYLGPNSIEVLRIIDEIAQKHSPAAN